MFILPVTGEGKSLNFGHYVTSVKPRSHRFIQVINSLQSCICLSFFPDILRSCDRKQKNKCHRGGGGGGITTTKVFSFL